MPACGRKLRNNYLTRSPNLPNGTRLPALVAKGPLVGMDSVAGFLLGAREVLEHRHLAEGAEAGELLDPVRRPPRLRALVLADGLLVEERPELVEDVLAIIIFLVAVPPGAGPESRSRTCAPPGPHGAPWNTREPSPGPRRRGCRRLPHPASRPIPGPPGRRRPRTWWPRRRSTSAGGRRPCPPPRTPSRSSTSGGRP